MNKECNHTIDWISYDRKWIARSVKRKGTRLHFIITFQSADKFLVDVYDGKTFLICEDPTLGYSGAVPIASIVAPSLNEAKSFAEVYDL